MVLTHVPKVQSLVCCLYTNPLYAVLPDFFPKAGESNPSHRKRRHSTPSSRCNSDRLLTISAEAGYKAISAPPCLRLHQYHAWNARLRHREGVPAFGYGKREPPSPHGPLGRITRPQRLRPHESKLSQFEYSKIFIICQYFLRVNLQIFDFV